jgi:hypothetical protein
MIKIVSPNEYAESDAPAGTDDRCCPAFRFQQLVPAEDFSALPHGGWLTEIAFRPDIEAPAGRIYSEWGRMTLDLSTTNMDPGDMLTAFDLNIHTSETRVLNLDSPILFEVENVGPAGEANEFDYVVTLDYPFFYDTTQGNLLFDWTSDGITGSPYG